MRYSQSTQLAVDSLLFMAAQPEQRDLTVEEISAAQGVSSSYLAKVFQQLVKGSVLRSYRGARGGYALARAPEEITLDDIVRIFEGTSPIYECRTHSKLCQLGNRCLVVGAFREAERRLHEALREVSLADLLARLAEHRSEAPWVAGRALPVPAGAAG